MGKKSTQLEHQLAVRVGGRIRRLRLIQHVSQIRLATEIGIRAGPLGWIEKGQHIPSGRVLYRIAKQLNVRMDDLFQESDIWQLGTTATTDLAPLLFPPLETTADVESAKAAHIVCQSVADKLPALAELCGADKRSGIPLCVPFTATYAGAEYVAARARQSLGIAAASVDAYLEHFESSGLRVVFMDMPGGCESFSGYDRLNSNAYFFVNGQLKKQPELQTFRLAFELGRVFWFTRALYGASAEAAQADCAGDSLLNEIQFAHHFASCFLLPAGALQATVWQLGLTPKTWTWDLMLHLKKRYGVSARNFALRLHELKLSWSDRQEKSPRYYLFKDEIEAFIAESGPSAEPGGNCPQLMMNGRLSELLLQAEQKSGDVRQQFSSLKRVLRQSGVRLDV